MSFKQIRKVIDEPTTTLDYIKSQYVEWVNNDQMLIFQHQRFHEKKRYIASLCPKRGNPKYAYNMQRKFAELTYPFDYEHHHQEYFDETHTSIIFVTLTYDTKLTDFKTAWKTISKDWNRFLSNIRRQYGRVLSIRSYEASEKGYPHIHAVLYLEQQNFPTFLRWSEKQKEYLWRIPYKEKEKMNKYWHSNIDVQGMVHLSEGFKYLGKYITKGSDISKKAVTTLACTWGFYKRAYSIGIKFKTEIFNRYLSLDLTPNSPSQTISTQMTLDQKELKETVPSFLKLPPQIKQKHGKPPQPQHEKWFDWRSTVHEKYVMLGVTAKSLLKKLGGVPKNEWSYGLNEQQTIYADYQFYNIKPKPVDNYNPNKNPFTTTMDCSEQAKRIIYKQLTRKQKAEPYPEKEWWEPYFD